MSAILQAARAAYAAGLAPVPTTNDGSKTPDLRTWKVYQTTRPSVEEMRTFNFAGHDGLGIIAGAGSGHRECWDFDANDVFLAFVDRAHASGLGELVDRLTAGYLDRTPNGGRRIIVTYPVTIDFKDVTLAKRPGRPGEPDVKVLIELPTFSIVAPSNGRTHPSGRAYERLAGDFSTIASYTVDERAALFALARTFDEMPRVEARSPSPKSTYAGTRPGDDFNRRTTWPQLLEAYGWTLAFDRDGVTYWRRPGKPYGVSATTGYGSSDLLYVFTSSTLFDADKSYSKFAAYTVLEHQGDFSKAALALFKDGYGADDRPEDDTETDSSSVHESSAGTTTTTTRSVRLIKADMMTLRPVRWLWEDRLPIGSFSLLAGREGIGKSVVANTLAADITRGTLPGLYSGTPKGVIIAATEDSWEHTIAPRLLAAQADLSRVYRADIVGADGSELPLSLPKDTAALLQAITDVDAALIIFDPLLSRLESRLDSHKDADVRRALEPLAAMADTGNVSVLGIVHVNKTITTDALTLLMGSRAFSAVARAVLFTAVNPDDEEQRLLSQVKNNLGKINLPTLLFRIRGVLVQTTASGEDIWTGRLLWEGESDTSIREVLERVGERADDAHARSEAEAWLLDYLQEKGGTVAKKAVIADGRSAGHSERTLHRARQHADIQTDFRGFPRQSFWLLPSVSRTASRATADPIETVETQSCHEPPVVPVVPRSEGRDSAGTTTPSPVEPVVPSSDTSQNGGTTGTTEDRGTTGPQLFDASPTEQQWRESDDRFKKGW